MVFCRMIASGVRRLSRSFYGESLSTSQHRASSFAEIPRDRASRKIGPQVVSQTQSDGDLAELKQSLDEKAPAAPSMAKKLSKINLKKLKIW